MARRLIEEHPLFLDKTDHGTEEAGPDTGSRPTGSPRSSMPWIRESEGGTAGRMRSWPTTSSYSRRCRRSSKSLFRRSHYSRRSSRARPNTRISGVGTRAHAPLAFDAERTGRCLPAPPGRRTSKRGFLPAERQDGSPDRQEVLASNHAGGIRLGNGPEAREPDRAGRSRRESHCPRDGHRSAIPPPKRVDSGSGGGAMRRPLLPSLTGWSSPVQGVASAGPGTLRKTFRSN